MEWLSKDPIMFHKNLVRIKYQHALSLLLGHWEKRTAKQQPLCCSGVPFAISSSTTLVILKM